MSDPLDLSIEQFAQLSALYKARGKEALPGEVRNRWDDIARALNERIEADLEPGSGQLAITFATVYRPALAALRVETAVPESHGVPAPAAYVATPTYLLDGPVEIASAPALHSERASDTPREATLDTTGEIDPSRVASPAVPFRGGDGVSRLPSSSQPDMKSTGTVEVDVFALRAEIFPFQGPTGLAEGSQPLVLGKDGLTLEAFASLKAELLFARDPLAQTLARYRVAERDFDAVCERWQNALAVDPEARARFDALVDEYVGFLRRRK